MKKYLLILLFSLLSLPAVAQKRWYIIPQIGVQISEINDNQDLDGDERIGYRLGALGEYQFSQGELGHIALQSGLFFSSKGFKIDSNEIQVSSQYLEIPLLLKWGIHLTREVDIHLKGGPYFGYWIGGKSVITHPIGSGPSQSQPFYCPYDYGVEVGLGATWKRIQWNIGSNIGLYDFYIDRSYGDKLVMKNQTFHCTIGFIF